MEVSLNWGYKIQCKEGGGGGEGERVVKEEVWVIVVKEGAAVVFIISVVCVGGVEIDDDWFVVWIVKLGFNKSFFVNDWEMEEEEEEEDREEKKFVWFSSLKLKGIKNELGSQIKNEVKSGKLSSMLNIWVVWIIFEICSVLVQIPKYTASSKKRLAIKMEILNTRYLYFFGLRGNLSSH